MSKPMFKDRIGWAEQRKSGSFTARDRQDGMLATYRVRVTDARRPSAPRAVEECLNLCRASSGFSAAFVALAFCPEGMTAKITNGKVKCQWEKEVEKCNSHPI